MVWYNQIRAHGQTTHLGERGNCQSFSQSFSHSFIHSFIQSVSLQSVGRLVGWSVGRSGGRSVGRSVGHIKMTLQRSLTVPCWKTLGSHSRSTDQIHTSDLHMPDPQARSTSGLYKHQFLSTSIPFTRLQQLSVCLWSVWKERWTKLTDGQIDKLTDWWLSQTFQLIVSCCWALTASSHH